jgi:hypothetical protein
MLMVTANLLLNCFPVELSQTAFDLPFVDYRTWEDSTRGLGGEYANFLAYRYKPDMHQIRVILLNGPEFPRHLCQMSAEVAELPHLGRRLIERSFVRHLTAKGLKVPRGGFGTTKVLRRAPEFSQGLLNVYAGISFQVRRPFREKPYFFTISIQWEVTPVFRGSLAEPTLRVMSIGRAVLYRPAAQTREVPPDLRLFRHRYLGHVSNIQSDIAAQVACRDGIERRIPLRDLSLEASPTTIRAYENQMGLNYGSRSVWPKMQEFNYVLTQGGRRNRSVLKDRLQAIKEFLGGRSREQLVLP